MSDAEYMMNNYTAAQNQGCWDDDYDDAYYDSQEFADQMAAWEEEYERIGKYKFDNIELNINGNHQCKDDTCPDWDKHNAHWF